jgi:hypothetical protein
VIPTWTVPAGERPTGQYSWGGFAIASNLALPRLWPTRAEPDTWFRWRSDTASPVGRPLKQDELRTRDGHRHRVAVLPEGIVRYQIETVGLYVVRADGRGIDFFPSPEANPMRVEHFLVNAILPIYAGLRSEVCLHASAVAPDGWATVFAGPSGSGKSTKALEAIDRGGILLGDDAVVVRRRGDDWLVHPGARTIRLHEGPPGPSWHCGPKYEWFLSSSKDPLPLAEVMVLNRNGDIGDAALKGSGLFRALLSLQPGWAWGDARTRRAIADQTAALCYRLISSTPSPAGPTAPPVRSHTLPSGSSVGASYESGQRSSTGRPL